MVSQIAGRKVNSYPYSKTEGDIIECNNYRGIKLMRHLMKLWERIIEARLREKLTRNVDNRASLCIAATTGEVYRKKSTHGLVYLEKAFDRIPRDIIWWCLRKKGVPEQYVKIVQDMHKSSKTQVVYGAR